jgi:hypothetical protein
MVVNYCGKKFYNIGPSGDSQIKIKVEISLGNKIVIEISLILAILAILGLTMHGIHIASSGACTIKLFTAVI